MRHILASAAVVARAADPAALFNGELPFAVERPAVEESATAPAYKIGMEVTLLAKGKKAKITSFHDESGGHLSAIAGHSDSTFPTAVRYKLEGLSDYYEREDLYLGDVPLPASQPRQSAPYSFTPEKGMISAFSSTPEAVPTDPAARVAYMIAKAKRMSTNGAVRTDINAGAARPASSSGTTASLKTFECAYTGDEGHVSYNLGTLSCKGIITLPCGHSVCRGCMRGAVASTVAAGVTEFECPEPG